MSVTDGQWKGGMLKNLIIPPLWLKAICRYVESEYLVWALLALCLIRPPALPTRLPTAFFPVFIYSQLGLFLCDPFSQGLPRGVCLAPGFERAIRSWVPAELSKAAALLAWCTIKDHERQFHNVITGLIVRNNNQTVLLNSINAYSNSQ